MTRPPVHRIPHDPIGALRERVDRDVYLDPAREPYRLENQASLNGDADGGS